MGKTFSCFCAAVGMFAASAVHAAVLSGNLVVNGDFESTANLKNDTSPDGVVPHRFSQEYDLGMWVGFWGPPENPGGLGGFSTYDDPRDVGETGGNTMHTGNIGNLNRSVDPTNPGNHLMEVTMFRPRFSQWIAAPENHVPGPTHFSFDFINVNGHAGPEDSWGRVFVYGMNVLPPHDVPFFNGTTPGAPNAMDPADPNKTDAERFDPVTGDGELLYRFSYGEWQQGIHIEGDDPFEYLGNWHTLSSDLYGGDVQHPDNPEGTMPVYAGSGEPYYAMWGGHKLTLDLEQTYPYYAVVVQPFVYSEQDPYFWLYSPDARVTDSFVIGFDNFNLQLSVLDDGPAPVPADFNVSGTVNTEDINPFILALTNTPGWIDSVRALLPDGWSDQQIMDYADPNQDGVINTEDINPFICWLTGGSNCAGGAPAIIPEPASLALLGMGALALIRRRR